MPTEFELWLSECRAELATFRRVPYVDEFFPKLSERVQDLQARPDTREGSQTWFQLAEELLRPDPNDLELRFALLFPIRHAFLAHSGTFPNASRPFPKGYDVFKRIVSVCDPANLYNRTSLLFELHNCYLARDWSLASRIFVRLRELDILGVSEQHAVEGHFWFVSVFGSRIEAEWLSIRAFAYDFHWDSSLPLILDPSWKETRTELLAFAFPEPLIDGSYAHWTLSAWASNPRFPTLRQAQPTVDELDFSKVDIEARDYPPSGRRGAEDPRVLDADRLYRTFEPLRPLQLSDDQRARLVLARDHILQASNASPSLAQPYEVVLARILFNLEQYEEAETYFGRVYARHFQFRDCSYPESVSIDYDWELSFFRALCRKLTGDYGQAIDTLKQLYDSAGNQFGAAWWIARWYTEQAQFVESAQWLRSEMQCSYTPAESWELSAAIAFADFADTDLQVDNFDRRLRFGNPGLHKVLAGLSLQLRPELNALSEGSWKHWIFAATMLHAQPLFEFCAEASYAKAVTSFATIAENEIKVNVFDSFLTRMNDPGFAEIARIEYRKRRDMEKQGFKKDSLLAFLFSKDHHTTLQRMADAITDCQNSASDTHKAFREYVALIAPRLLTKSARLKRLAELRDPPSHAPVSCTRDDALSSARLCVELVGCTQRPKDSKVSAVAPP